MRTYTDKTQENTNQSASLDNSTNNKDSPTFQFVDQRPEAIAQRKLQAMANNSDKVKQMRAFQTQVNNSHHVAQLKEMVSHNFDQEQGPIQRKANTTGLPDNLKTGIENLSGYSMDDVKVHYNSDKPAQLQAHAYAQGTDIHLGAGQEKHLPHEAWHVVQQKQGRVRPTMQLKGKVNVNDDVGLEREADVMGMKALQLQIMNTHTDKTQENKSQSVSNETSQKQESTFQFEDNRPQAIIQRRLQKLGNNSKNSRTIQMRNSQGMANNDPQIKQLKRSQAITQKKVNKSIIQKYPYINSDPPSRKDAEIYGIFKQTNGISGECIYVGQTTIGRWFKRFQEHVSNDTQYPWYIKDNDYSKDEETWPYVTLRLEELKDVTKFEVTVAEQWWIENKSKNSTLLNSQNAMRKDTFLKYKDTPYNYDHTRIDVLVNWAPAK